MNKLCFFFFATFFISLLLVTSLTPSAFAANTIMSANPLSGNYVIGTPFSVNMLVDGHGDNFNAAKATVSVSNNLTIQNLTLGDCNFSFLTTPTTTNPSFGGVILGGSSKGCTLYTLTLLPTAAGEGTVTIMDAQVKQYGGGSNVLSSTENSIYTLMPTATGASIISAAPNSTETNIFSSLPPNTIVVKVLQADNLPIAGARVLLDPANAKAASGADAQPVTASSDISSQTATTDVHGIVEFTGVPKGIHTVIVKKDNKPIATNIISVDGKNPVVLGIHQEKQQNTLLIIVISSIIALILLVIIIFVFKKLRNNNVSMPLNSETNK